MCRPRGTPLDSLSVNNERDPFHCLAADTLKGDQLKANWIKRVLEVSSVFGKKGGIHVTAIGSNLLQGLVRSVVFIDAAMEIFGTNFALLVSYIFANPFV